MLICMVFSGVLCGVQLGNGEYIKDTWDNIFNKFIKVLNLNGSGNLKLKGKSVLFSLFFICLKK